MFNATSLSSHINAHLQTCLKKTSYTWAAVKKSLTISKHLSLVSRQSKTAHEEKTPTLLRPDSYKAAY